MSAYHLLFTIHLLAAGLMLGGVFMNAFVVWPSARATLGRNGFPLEFFVDEGRRIAPWIYLGLGTILVSGVGLFIVQPPVTSWDFVRLAVRAAAYAVMLGNTLYGTLRIWPAIQFTVQEEGWLLWRRYLRLGRVTFAGSLVLFVLGAWSK